MEVSVIVLNLNGAHLLPDALASLNRQTADSYEIIVSDNGSTDQSEKIAAEFGARFVPLGRNYGFARGNNLAVEHAKGKFILFANNDMRFESECIQSLEEALNQNPDVFAADCIQRRWGTKDIIHAGTTIRRGTWASSTIPYLEINPAGIRDRRVAVPWTCAGNMMVRKIDFLELGGFDAKFFANAEDVDICLRAWMRGRGSLFVPHTGWKNAVEHKVGSTSKPLRDWRMALTQGNYLRFLLKASARGSLPKLVSSYCSLMLSSPMLGETRNGIGRCGGLLMNLVELRDTLRARRRTLLHAHYSLECVISTFVAHPNGRDPKEILAELDRPSRLWP